MVTTVTADATSLLPSEEQATDRHPKSLDALVRLQVTPESAEVYYLVTGIGYTVGQKERRDQSLVLVDGS